MSDPLDVISEQIGNLTLETNMASFQIKSADYDHIPNFDGNPHNLLKFVNVVRQVRNIVCAQNNTFRELNEKRLLSKILARLTGEADYINTTCEFETVEELLNYLERTFRDSRSIEQLTFELFNTNIKHKEHPLDFLQRIDKNRTLIISRHRIDKTINRETVIAHLESQLLYHFFTNMPLHVRTYLMTKTDKLKNLDDLRNLIQNENHLLFDDLVSSGSMNRAGEKQNTDSHYKKRFQNEKHFSNNKKQYNNKFYYQPQFTNGYKNPNQNPNQNNFHQRSYQNQPHQQAQASRPQEKPQHNQEWHPRDQNAYFNKPPPPSNNYQRPYNGTTGQTVSMRTVNSFRNRQPMYGIENQEIEEDPRDIRIRELENQVQNFLEPSHSEKNQT